MSSIQPIRTLLADDEAGCLENLAYYITNYCPSIQIVATAGTAEETARLLKEKQPDLAFLDIHLCRDNSLDIVESMQTRPFGIVFVTAYEQYALRAIRVSALDYLLKPLEKEEILRCYEKIVSRFSKESAEHQPPGAAVRCASVIIRQGDAVYRVRTDDIISVQARGFYSHVSFEHDGHMRQVTISKPLTALHLLWADAALERVHRSYLVNPRKIKSVRNIRSSLFLLMTSDAVIPVAKRRKDMFLSRAGS